MISVIIPCYNAEPFLAEALESVVKQTRPVGEILVVDDGSTDRSADIARSYGARVISGRNSGNAAARNVGIEAARSDLIAWLDADDYWNLNHCEVVCGLLERHPDGAVAYSAMRLFGTKSGVHYQSPRDHEPFDGFWETFRNCIVSSSPVMWRSAYLEVGGFDPRILTGKPEHLFRLDRLLYRYEDRWRKTANRVAGRPRRSLSPDRGGNEGPGRGKSMHNRQRTERSA